MALYEATFAAACDSAFHEKRLVIGELSAGDLTGLEDDKEFQSALVEGTTQTKNVKLRLRRAKALIPSL